EVTFGAEGKLAFVANGESNDVTVIDVATRQVVKTIAVDHGPVGGWPGKDGLVYVDCEEEQTIAVIDPAKLAVVRTIALGFTPGMASAAGGGDVWVSDSGGNVVLFDSKGAERARIATAAGAHGLAFSPDGHTGYVTNQLAGSLSIFDAQTHMLVKTVPTGV